VAGCVACKPNEATCTDNILTFCDKFGLGPDETREKTCGVSTDAVNLPVCNPVAGACQQCADGAKICDKGFALTCLNGVYPVGKGQDCQGVARCQAGECVAAVCEPGTFTCGADPSKIRYCKTDGSDFRAAEDCAVGTTCVDGKGCVACDPPDGPTKCEGNILTKCVSGVPGAGPTKEIIATCADMTCVNGATQCTQCENGTFQCAGQELKICKSGVFVAQNTCKPSEVCDQANGKCTECKPGTARCTGDDLQICDSSGTFGAPKACGAGLCDAVDGVCDECVGPLLKCNGAQLRSCNDRGSFEDVGLPCDTPGLCNEVAGRCEVAFCDVGEVQCSPSGQQPQLCNADRTKFVDNGARCVGACQNIAGDPQVGCVDTVKLSVGADAACVIVGTQKHAVCWGRFGAAQSGIQPQYIPGLDGLATIELAPGFACALTDGGKVLCLGDNTFGQIGAPQSVAASSTPFVVPLSGEATSIAVGRSGACVTLTDGSVSCWGRLLESASPTFGPQIAFKQTPSSKVIAGDNTRCLLTNDKNPSLALCWGNDANGRRGAGNLTQETVTDPDLNKPVVVGLGGTTPGLPQPLAPIQDLSLSGGHGCALQGGTAAGAPNLFCWGANGASQLGLGTVDQKRHPVAAPVGTTPFTAVATGNSFTCGIDGTGQVLCWGNNAAGQAGQVGGGTPILAPSVASVSTKATGPIVAIDAGNDHTCVLTAKGKLFCWGSNANGQLGLPPGTPQFSAAAIAVPLP
jgi:hypothetical protein